MQAIYCKLKNLGQAFQQLKAMEGEYQRKQNAIAELREGFLKSGKSWGLADHLAKERYLQIHKNNLQWKSNWKMELNLLGK